MQLYLAHAFLVKVLPKSHYHITDTHTHLHNTHTHSLTQVLAYLDGALEAAGNFDDEQQYSLSMSIEPKQEQRGSKARLL